MIDLTGYKLTFDDEFNTRSLSQTGTGTTWSDIRPQWRFDANSDIGFGTSSFVDAASGYDPFSVSGGTLSITAVPDRTSFGYPGSHESGLISTEGNFSQTYGYFEMRAQTSGAPGSWDAFWMLPNTAAANPSNASGWQELDVVEHYGGNDKGVYSTIHTTDQTPNIPWQQNRQVYSETAGLSTSYHTYGMDWEPDKISFYVDGKFEGSQATPSDMHSPMYLLANLATQSDASASAMTTKIDYIRAFSKDPAATAVLQGTVSAPDGHDPGLYGATAASPVAATTPSAVVTATPSPIVTAAPSPVVTTAASSVAPSSSPSTLTVIATDTSALPSSETVTAAAAVPGLASTTVDPALVGLSRTATASAAPAALAPNAATQATPEQVIGAFSDSVWDMPAVSQHELITGATTRVLSVLQRDSAALGASASFDDVASKAISFLQDHPGYGLAATLLQGVQAGYDGGPVSDLVSNLVTDQNPRVFTATTGYYLGHMLAEHGF